MKLRWLSVGIVVGLLIALTFGFAWSRGTGSMMGGSGMPGMMGGSGMAGMMGGGSGMMTGSFDPDDMKAMHDSSGMREMHERMPAALRARCDELHEEMWS